MFACAPPPGNPAKQLGRISTKQKERVLRYIDSGKADAKLVYGGAEPAAVKDVRKSFLPEFISMNAMMAGMAPVMSFLMMGRDMRAMEPTEHCAKPPNLTRPARAGGAENLAASAV